MIKKTDGYLLMSLANHRYIVKVRAFLSARTVLNLTKSMKLNNNAMVVSVIVSSDDAYTKKADEVNVKLEK